MSGLGLWTRNSKYTDVNNRSSDRRYVNVEYWDGFRSEVCLKFDNHAGEPEGHAQLILMYIQGGLVSR